MELLVSRKKLLRLLSHGRFCSERFLANALGISPTCVWKQIDSLVEFGFEIDAVSGRGYRLLRPLELLDERVIRSGLTAEVTKQIGAFHIHDRIDSTNRFLSSGLPGQNLHGAICLAESQTAGKGRSGKSWISPFGNNVYLSLAWQYPVGPAVLSSLSLALGVAVVRALSTLGVPDIRLKWPNDILWNEKKLGGILIELSGDAHGPCTVIIGLGLNCAMSTEQGAAIEQKWVDLERISHQSKPGRNCLIASLINEMLPVIAKFYQTGLAPFLDEWRAADCMQGKEVVLYSGRCEIAGTVAGISDEGLIRLYTRAGELRSYASGEVSFRPDRG